MNCDRIYEHYHGDPSSATTKRCRERIHWMCGQVEGERVLDIGCSQGIACMILGREGFDCVGVDLEQTSIEFAAKVRDEEEGVRGRIDLSLASAGALPFADGSFDTVILGEILEHLTQPGRVLKEASRVLKAGGKAIVTVPYGLKPHPDHKRIFYASSLLETLQPYFQTTIIEPRDHYLLYSGVKPDEPRTDGAGPVGVADLLRLQRDLEQRCLAKEMALHQKSGRVSRKAHSLSEQVDTLQASVEERDKALEEAESELKALAARTSAESERLENELREEREANARALEEKEEEIREVVAERERETEARVATLEADYREVLATEREEHVRVLAGKEEERRQVLADQEREAERRIAVLEADHRAALAASERAAEAERIRREVDEEGRARERRLRLATREETVRKEDDATAEMALGEADGVDGELAADIGAVGATLRELEKRLKRRLKSRAGDRREAREEQRRDRIERIRKVVRTELPEGSSILVVSRGDDEMLHFDGRRSEHFPQEAGGEYAGHHPANDAEAIGHLNDLVRRGAADYLLIPSSAYWWLEHYREFRDHLERSHPAVAFEEQACLIFDLRPKDASTPGRENERKRPAATPPATSQSPRSVRARPLTTTAPFTNGNGKSASVPVLAVAPPSSNGTPAGKGTVIAGVLDEFTTDCLRPECRLITFRPDNWREVLEPDRPRAVFVESAWRGNSGSWQYRVASYGRNVGDELNHLVEWAREQQIPSIFWNKEDPVHFDRFVEQASLFDIVFTSDIDCIPAYRERLGHDRVFALPFAAQPAIHNPILESRRDGRVCFAGTYYGDRHEKRRTDMEHVLKPALDFGLDIYDRQHGLAGRQAELYRFPDIYRPHIRGRLDYDEMVRAYKRYRVFLNVNSVSDSSTMFSRRVFELLASGTPIISTYSRGIAEMLGEDAVFFTESVEDTRRHLEALLSDTDVWDRASVRGIRRVMMDHTYESRLGYVLEKAGVDSPVAALPHFAIVAAIDTPECTERLLDWLQNQAYRDFDLLLVGDAQPDAEAVLKLDRALGGRKVVPILRHPGELSARCLQASDAEYFAFLHSRDHYGPNYLQDYALAIRYSGASLLGKAAFSRLTFGGNSKVVRLGGDYRYVSEVAAGTLVAHRSRMSGDLFRAALEADVVRRPIPEVLSIDRFNYLQSPRGVVGNRVNRLELAGGIEV
ncbi:MAG: methyltransferase domain-containing protein [Gemmatimonas sp.]|nr:methyltransferase domain-containing protein [Gemmatimonas sp.]